MDPLTALGAVASVAQLAATALSLSKTLYSLGAAIASASDDIQVLADDLKTFSQSLTLLSRLLEDSKSWYSDDIYLLTAKIIRDCAELYVKIDKILVKLGGNGKSTWKLRVKFVVYKEGQIRKLLSRLRDMKGTLATILMSLQVDLQLSLLNISSSSKIQRPAEKPLEPETLRTLKQAQEAVEAGEFLPKYTVHSEQVILSSEGVELSSARYEISSQIQCSNIVGTPSAADGKLFPTFSRGLDSDRAPFSNPFGVTQSFAVLPSLDQGFPPVIARDTEMTPVSTSTMQDLCRPGDRFQNANSMNHERGISRDEKHSTDTKMNGSPTRSLKSSSSTESFKSAMSLQEEDLNLARKVKAVQSVMHAFRTALEILSNLVDRRIHDKHGELYLAAKKLEDSLDNGSKAIDRKHISNFKQHGQSYIQLFTEPRSEKLQSISSNLMTEVVMKLHQYSAEHEDLQKSCFEALYSSSENTYRRVLQYLNRVARQLPVKYALGLAGEEDSVADEVTLSAETHPQFKAWPYPNENTSPKLALPIRHHTNTPYLHRDQLSPSTLIPHTTPSSLPFIGYTFKRVDDSEDSRSLNYESPQQISPPTNSNITQFSRVGFSLSTGLDAVQAPLGTTNARDSAPRKLPWAISSPSTSENKNPNGDGIDEPLKNLESKAQGRKRTKTGCLTCRKRLIKCGEERPTCQNCTKSKRQCEGYNQRVVFKDPLNAYRPSLSTPSHISFPGPNHGQAVSPDGQRHLISQQSAPGQNPLPIAPRPFGLGAKAADTASMSDQQPAFGPLDSSSSEDESMPPAPLAYAFSFSEKKQIATTSFNSKQEPSISQPEHQAFFNHGQQRTASSLPPAIGLDAHYERFESAGSTIYEPPPGSLAEAARAKYLENRTKAKNDELLSRPRRQEDEYYYRRDVRDVGARRDSVSDESDSSDYVVSRRTIRKERGRSQSPHHKRHLAEGALAGAGAAALVSNHRDKPGDGPEHRGRKVLGSAALGAVGAEVTTRARSRGRESQDDESRSRSRSSSPSVKMSKIRATTGFPGAVGYYRLTTEEEEEVAATKQQIRLMKQQDVSSSRNSLRIGSQAEETGRATLARLGAHGERISNTEKNLDLSAKQNTIAEQKAKELKTLNKSMFAVHAFNLGEDENQPLPDQYSEAPQFSGGNTSEGKTKLEILNDFVEDQLNYVLPQKERPADSGAQKTNLDFVEDSDEDLEAKEGLRELSIKQPGSAPGGGGNHALQDYQTQLMLLEQQNKERLMMARQEQDDMMPRADGPDGQGGAPGAVVPNGQPFQGTLPQGPSSVNPDDQMKRGTPHMNPARMEMLSKKPSKQDLPYLQTKVHREIPPQYRRSASASASTPTAKDYKKTPKAPVPRTPSGEQFLSPDTPNQDYFSQSALRYPQDSFSGRVNRTPMAEKPLQTSFFSSQPDYSSIPTGLTPDRAFSMPETTSRSFTAPSGWEMSDQHTGLMPAGEGVFRTLMGLGPMDSMAFGTSVPNTPVRDLTGVDSPPSDSGPTVEETLIRPELPEVNKFLPPPEDASAKNPVTTEAEMQKLEEYQKSLLTLTCGNDQRLMMVRKESEATHSEATETAPQAADTTFQFESLIDFAHATGNDILYDFDFDSFLHQDGEPMDFKLSAKATGPSGRTASYQRRVLDQEEAVRMPGNHEVDRAAVKFGAFNLKGYGDEDVDGKRGAFPDGLAQIEKDSSNNEPLTGEQTTSSAPRQAPVASTSDEDVPLFVNRKQFHRILKRRVARQKLEEKLKAQRSRLQKRWHHSLPLRRPRGLDGRFLTQEQIAEQEKAKQVEVESQTAIQQGIRNEPTDASSTAKQASQPDYISSPDYQPTNIELSSLPGQTELTSAFPALSQSQLSKLWWQTYISLHATDPTSSRTVAEELQSELGVFATGSLSDELICKRISTNIKRIGTALHDDKLNIDGMLEIMEMRGNAIRIMTTVELQLGLEVATLGWSCVWTFLAVHEYVFASSQCEVPETMQILKTSFTNLQDIVAIIARYAVMENLYHQTGSALSLSLKPEYQSSLVALCTTVLQFFAASFDLGRNLSQINIGEKHGEEELVKRCGELINEIKKMDRECQGFRVLVDTVREESDDSGSEDVGIEDVGDESWEVVDAGVIRGYGGAGVD